MIISLAGFMGCGKSGIGRELASLLGCPAVDLDEVIQRRAGRKIPEIFESEGEAGFRRMELEALREVLCAGGETDESSDVGAVIDRSEVGGPQADMETGSEVSGSLDGSENMILSLGGGTLTTPECAKLIHDKTFCIYLRAGIDNLVENLEEDGIADRPMLSGVCTPKDGNFDSLGRRHESRSEGTPLRERITELMNARTQDYEKTAHKIMDIDGETPHETAQRIADLLN